MWKSTSGLKSLAQRITLFGLCLSVGGCMFGSKQTYRADGVANFALPEGWTHGGVDRHGVWSAVEFWKSQTWRFGSGDPREVEGWVILGSPHASANEMEKGMDFAMHRLQTHSRRFPEFGDMKTDTRTTWMSEGNYQIGSNHDPEKVLFLRSLDPAKQVALVLRVYLRKIPHEKLRAIEHDFFGSLAYQEGRANHFAEAALSVDAQQRRADELAYVNNFLSSHRLPPIDPHNPSQLHAHDGWVYQIHAGHFVIGRRLGDREKAGIVESARGELTWLDYDDDAWQAKWPQEMKRPQGNERYFHGQPVPPEWSKVLALDTDRTRRYFFHALRCELTPEDSPESHDPSTWESDHWFAQAQVVERQFRAGQLGL